MNIAQFLGLSAGSILFVGTPTRGDQPISPVEPVAEHKVVKIGPRYDLHHPFRIGANYYPTESKRDHEQGKCTVTLTVEANGVISNVSIAQSSGYLRLDRACLDAVMPGQMFPATEDGLPVKAVVDMHLAWVLK